MAEKIFPHGKDTSVILSGEWPWGAKWDLFLGHNRPQGAPSTSAGCVLLSPEGIVFTKTHRQGWEIPGGRIGLDAAGNPEDIHTVLEREVHEEAGAKLVWSQEVGVKVIYNPPGQTFINSETGIPFPEIGFQEYFVGWCDGQLEPPTGEEVQEARIFALGDIDEQHFAQMPEPYEFYLFLKYFNDTALTHPGIVGRVPQDFLTFWKDHVSPQLSVWEVEIEKWKDTHGQSK